MASFPPSDHHLQNSCAESSKMSKYVCGIIKITIFLINVSCRSDANMINWPHVAIFANFEL